MPGFHLPFTIKFETTQVAARQSINAVIGRLLGFGISVDRCGDIEIVLTEAVNNVVEHACHNILEPEAWISCWIKDKALIVEVIDTGRPMPIEGLPTGSRKDLSVPIADLPEGGFGWLLIRQIAETVVYDRKEGRNILSLEFGPEKKVGRHETAMFAPHCRPKQKP